MYLLDGEDNCMLSVPCTMSDLHFSSWQSGEKLPGGGCCSFHVTWLRFVVFFKTRVLSFFYLSCCLPHALCARCFPSFRPDTASIRSCLLLPPGFLDTREAGICAGSRAWSSSLFPCLVLHLLAVPGASSSPWEPAKPQDKACFWERMKEQLPPLKPRTT